MVDDQDLTDRECISMIDRLLKSLVNWGIDPGYAPRMFNGGEFGLCFRSIFYAAKSNDKFFETWSKELLLLNQHFAKQKYYAKHCGFPLER